MPLPSRSRMSVTMTSGLVSAMAATASSSDSAKPTTTNPPIDSRLSMIRLRIRGESSTRKTRTSAVSTSTIESTHQVVLQSVGGQVGVARALHLLQDARAIGADRLHRKVHLVRDLRDGLAAGELDEDLEFAVRQLAMRRLGRVARSLERERLGQRRADVLASRRHGADRFQKI